MPFERVADPFPVVVIDAVAEEPPQVLFIQRNDMVENLAATASGPAFGNAVLPRGLNARGFRVEARCLEKRDNAGIETGVVVEDGIAKRSSLRKRLAQWLHHPFCGWLAGDAEMQNPAPAMLNCEEAIQELECQRRDGRDVEDDDHLTMFGKEGEPAVGRVAASPQTSEVSGDSVLGDIEAGLPQFPVGPWRSPAYVFSRHAADENANFFAHLGSTAARPRQPAPVPAKARPMPSDHRGHMFRSVTGRSGQIH